MNFNSIETDQSAKKCHVRWIVLTFIELLTFYYTTCSSILSNSHCWPIRTYNTTPTQFFL